MSMIPFKRYQDYYYYGFKAKEIRVIGDTISDWDYGLSLKKKSGKYLHFLMFLYTCIGTKRQPIK